MSEPFIGEIRIFAGNFAPRNWAFCNGQTLPINQNTALFSLLGTTYGGDGRTNFNLPNLKGRAVMGEGTGPGLTNRRLGGNVGQSTTTLTEAQIPAHAHTMMGSNAPATTQTPDSTSVLGRAKSGTPYGSTKSGSAMDASTISPTGGGQAHNNQQPYLAVNYIIALTGLYPSRS